MKKHNIVNHTINNIQYTYIKTLTWTKCQI